MEKRSYEVTAAGWIDGTYREAGAALLLTAVEAEHLLIAGTIALAPPPKVATKRRTDEARTSE